jgi:hypothetical protein
LMRMGLQKRGPGADNFPTLAPCVARRTHGRQTPLRWRGYYSRRWWRIPFCPAHRIFARFCASPTSLLTSLRAHMVHRHLTSHLSEGRGTGLPSSGCAECPQRQGQPEQFLHGVRHEARYGIPAASRGNWGDVSGLLVYLTGKPRGDQAYQGSDACPKAL